MSGSKSSIRHISWHYLIRRRVFLRSWDAYEAHRAQTNGIESMPSSICATWTTSRCLRLSWAFNRTTPSLSICCSLKLPTCASKTSRLKTCWRMLRAVFRLCQALRVCHRGYQTGVTLLTTLQLSVNGGHGTVVQSKRTMSPMHIISKSTSLLYVSVYLVLQRLL